MSFISFVHFRRGLAHVVQMGEMHVHFILIARERNQQRRSINGSRINLPRTAGGRNTRTDQEIATHQFFRNLQINFILFLDHVKHPFFHRSLFHEFVVFTFGSRLGKRIV